MRFEISNIEELDIISEHLINYLKGNVCLILDGQMGAGKTTFTKNLLKKVGVKEIVTSPTFNIMNQYKLHDLNINHIDAYRLTNEEDEQMYLEQMIDSFNIVEWSKNLAIKYENYFKVIKLKIEVIDENIRVFNLEGVN
ncbi:tRNA (adenosine(37)-N6)-threonylcarbamoyltransferase complex ATPase subunit type 1 TsaE [Spiroplasma monobiae]|uniref:tRNA threonylcarbamoyladenosine biosynthesis protein TsaE n=1 Tax=Spiroplasma monobiae MQ-1 TaxID=1336748 RepID=A0A2K9LTK8_SPISQ|nr:tRNA (adenosine(37)-N6)-threonylcarbamoyltransferase complex ATPase subunit type 1 TsaE [Spiroplasma monobiae]AUM62408.1 tRNA threonylcarbamoyladenosine biosynthesis protein TsaE [Spiroplasma monobiae MQ-1]